MDAAKDRWAARATEKKKVSGTVVWFPITVPDTFMMWCEGVKTVPDTFVWREK
jgi:hypothetical protein